MLEQIDSIYAVLALVALALACGGLLGYASIKFKTDEDPIVDQIDAILPQTQCGQCGHPGCRPYAEAVANGEEHNRCAPGGEVVIQQLSDLLGRDPLPLDAEEGHDIPKVAYIHEDLCIGCTKCLQACPVDAIIGSAKHMHTVIPDECTGCDLCVDPCPVDCIDMIPLSVTPQTWIWDKPTGIGQAPGDLIPVRNIA